MGNKVSCCTSQSPVSDRHHDDHHSEDGRISYPTHPVFHPVFSISNLQHISEREPEDFDADPSTHPTAGPIFMQRSKSDMRYFRERRSQSNLLETRPLKKSSSCSTIYLDDSTVSQPNLRNTLKCVTLAIYYHIHNRTSNRTLDIFDEKLHPLFKDKRGDDYDQSEPEHRHIYKFVRTLFGSAQLTAECAIITLVYLERLLTYAEIDIVPMTWRRIVLGAILLASKVWDDQAVWNVDYCQILKDISVEDMNELERQFLEMLQFNINVPASVYAKYYFDLRSLADQNEFTFLSKLLSKERAQRLEAMSSAMSDVLPDSQRNAVRKCYSFDNMRCNTRKSAAILS